MGLLEPGAVKAARRGSEGAPAQQCAGATRPLSRPGMRPGTAGKSFAGQQVRGSRISGQAAPGAWVLPGGRAQLAVDLAGGVALEAADDLRLGLSFCRAALSVGACGRIRARAGEHD